MFPPHEQFLMLYGHLNAIVTLARAQVSSPSLGRAATQTTKLNQTGLGYSSFQSAALKP